MDTTDERLQFLVETAEWADAWQQQACQQKPSSCDATATERRTCPADLRQHTRAEFEDAWACDAQAQWDFAVSSSTGGKLRPTSEEFLTRETAYDLRLACRGFVAFCRHYIDIAAPIGIIPRICNQDPVEGHFSRARANGGQRTTLNAYQCEHAQSGIGIERSSLSGNVSAKDDTYAPMAAAPNVGRKRKRQEALLQQVELEGAALADSFGFI